MNNWIPDELINSLNLKDNELFKFLNLNNYDDYIYTEAHIILYLTTIGILISLLAIPFIWITKWDECKKRLQRFRQSKTLWIQFFIAIIGFILLFSFVDSDEGLLLFLKAVVYPVFKLIVYISIKWILSIPTHIIPILEGLNQEKIVFLMVTWILSFIAIYQNGLLFISRPNKPYTVGALILLITFALPIVLFPFYSAYIALYYAGAVNLIIMLVLFYSASIVTSYIDQLDKNVFDTSRNVANVKLTYKLYQYFIYIFDRQVTLIRSNFWFKFIGIILFISTIYSILVTMQLV